MEFSSRNTLFACVILLGLAVQSSLAGTAVNSGKSLHGAASINNINHATGAVETERGGFGGWSYPTGYSWSSGASLPLVLIPLIYFGFLWCVLLFGLSAFHHSPDLHRGYHGGHGGHGHGGGQGHGHHRYRRDDVFDDDYTQQRVLSSL